MQGFKTKKQRAEEAPAPADPGPRGFRPGLYSRDAAVAQAQNQAPDTVPAMVKPGEFVLPPDTVHAMGGPQALQGVVDATHMPARGFAPRAHPEEPRQFFADGGLVKDEQQLQQGAAPRGFAGFVADAFPNTTAAVKGTMQDAKDAYQTGGLGAAVGQSARVAAAPLIGLADDVATSAARALDPAANALKTFVTGDATPIGQTAPATPGTPAAMAKPAAPPATTTPAAPAAPTGAGQQPTAGTQAASPAPTASAVPQPGTQPATQDAKQVMPGVFRHGDGQYSDSAAGMGLPSGFTGQPNAQNLAAADNLVRGFTPGGGAAPAPSTDTVRGFAPAGISAPTVRHSGNDWLSRNELRNAQVSADSIMNTRRWGGKGAENNPDVLAYQTLLRADLAARGAQPGLDQEAMRQNGGLQREQVQQAGGLLREQLQQAGANLRSARGFEIDRQRVGIENQRAAGEAETRGFQTRAALQQEQLRGVLMDPNATAQQKAQAQASLQALNGKGDSWKAVALQGGTDAQGNKTESILGAVNERTGEMKRMDGPVGGAAQAGAIKMPPASERPVGSTSTVNGKVAVWDGQKWVPRG